MLLVLLLLGAARSGVAQGRPPIPDRMNPDDSAYLVHDAADPRFIYFRRLVSVMFTDKATDAQVRAFFTRFKARVTGGVPATGEYYLQIPDPGPTYADLDRVLTEMERAPGVLSVVALARTSPKGPLEGAP
jgi:hypothetical protein